ncbi:helix-turn-helix domain-containing protein [Aquimarina sp. U1-2]|uniref:AraC family transcriptional regulator n=1 Tax=Aquimarina sp. U1-2 TaxID=2823141 RepID=UPI001AED055C|nr:AraC family transcriptional regulator [Aquimarina sp. U1-2]MBP2832154.1 helix-turn-helix domain-containing protein [Aquimarina sp. U1-2]
MQISYEQIYLEQSKSLKIESYTHKSRCNIINWHLHPEYELVFIKSGKGSIHINSYYENYDNGMLVFLGPNIPHMPFGNNQFKNNVEVVIQFPESFISEKLLHFPEFNLIVNFLKRSCNGLLFSSKTHQQLQSRFLKFSKQNNIEKLLNFMDVLYHLSIATDQKQLLKTPPFFDIDKQSFKRISKVYQYVNDFYANDIRSDDMAKILGLTPNSFCRMFRNATQRNFIDFLNEFRIKKAQEYFDNGKTSIAEVMFLCGFNDPSYFSRQFKRYLGVSPSFYQNLQLTR